MSTPTDEVTLDIDALDAAKAKKVTDKPNSTEAEPEVVVDAELAAKTDDKPVLTPEDGLDKLKKQLADEKVARVAAEARAQEAAHGEAAARGDVQKSHLEQIQGAIENATKTKGILKAKYAEAAAIGDWAAAAEVQSEMADNAADIRQLKTGETALKNAPKPTPRAPVDPVEAFCTQLSGPSATWVRAHPEFVTDPHKQRQMLAAHELAIARGNTADTDPYFKSIEKTLDLTAPAALVPAHVDDPEPTADAAARATGGRSAAPAAAPVSRSGNGAGGRPGVVKLGPQQREMARNLFPDSKDPDLEYAKNMTLEERKRGPV
jgi:hypothetical protein